MENGYGESAVITKARYVSHRVRETVWTEHAGTVGELLASLRPDVERVYLTGAMPWGTGVTGVRLWVSGDLPHGWHPSDRGHYMDGDTPTLRFARPGRKVEVMSGSTWFGDVDAETGAQAWAALGDAVARRFRRATLLSTPASTGRDLFLRSLGGREFPVLSSDVQELIRSTSGQGRIEWFDGPEALSELVEYDGRLMYAGCARELGHGVPTLDTVDDFAGYTRGRYDVTLTVPRSWDHVGLVGVTHGREGWRWPNEPGETFRTWCDAAELHVAVQQGWAMKVHQRLLFPEHRGRPLDGWIRGLLDIYERQPLPWVRHAVRAMVLHGIGAFHGRPHKVSRSSVHPGDVPQGVAVTFDRLTGLYEWTEKRAAAWPELSHPEWSAAVWGRARARLLVSPGGAGMLTVRPGSVVACRTDAIYLDHDPEWEDTGRVGSFRRVGQWSHDLGDGSRQTFYRPRSLAELQAVTNG